MRVRLLKEVPYFVLGPSGLSREPGFSIVANTEITLGILAIEKLEGVLRDVVPFEAVGFTGYFNLLDIKNSYQILR